MTYPLDPMTNAAVGWQRARELLEEAANERLVRECGAGSRLPRESRSTWGLSGAAILVALALLVSAAAPRVVDAAR
jgi:hypothetical protein